MANIADFHLWAIWPPPRLFKDSETPTWLGFIWSIRGSSFMTSAILGGGGGEYKILKFADRREEGWYPHSSVQKMKISD